MSPYNATSMVVIFTESILGFKRAGAYRISSELKKHGVDTRVIDTGRNLDKILAYLDKHSDIEWVGFSIPYLDYNKRVSRLTDMDIAVEEQLIAYLRNRNIKIILGGSNADTIKHYVNNFYVMVGYSDIAIMHFHNYVVNHTTLIYETINDNKVIYADTHYGDIDLGNTITSFPVGSVKSNEMLPIEISRGCIFKCAFCEFGYLGKKPGTYIRPKHTIRQEIEDAYNIHGVDTFSFLDDTFNDSVEKMTMIKEIREDTGIPFKFWSYGRLDLLASNPDMIELMGEIGWQAVTFGVETLNKKTGSSVGKGASPDKLKECLISLKEKYPTLHIQVNLIIGLPHNTKEDIKESIDWFLETGVTDYLRVVDLDIRDPNGIEYSSLFSKNPTKYGFQIISTDGIRYNWSNSNFNNKTAREYAKEINDYIDQNKKSNIPFHVHYKRTTQ